MYRSIIVIALMTLVFWSCKDDMNQTGYDLLLPGDKISAHKVATDKASIQSFTVRDEMLRTNKPEFNLLGTIVDPVFGKTTADFACQFRLSEYPSFQIGHQIDSLVLYITYRSFYGDTLTVQNFKAYELLSDLKAADTVTYYQDIDLKSLAASEPVGEVNHRIIHRDSLHSSASKVRDTITMVIRMTLKPELAQKLMQESFAALSANPETPNIPFLQAFKGLYIEAGDLTQGGAIAQTDPQALVMYTRKTSATTDTVTSATYFYVTKNSARVNRFVHDYSTTAFAPNLDQVNQQDSLLYLQTAGGLSNKVFINGINNWKDSTSAAINKAELVFKVEGSTIDTSVFTPAPTIILSLIDKNGNIHTSKDGVLTQNYILPSDLSFSQAYYGGVYNPEDSTYRFNLAKHMQEIVKGKTENYGFYLSTYNKNAIYNRVVLKGATSKPGIRFDITYTKTN
ncbi:MAG TPA: DUF4270 domain-containing protein [Prolixibacteraceae bacterium]|nr:DUF4270 domain-containing protein [Prolixibacteraceae bacterium]